MVTEETKPYLYHPVMGSVLYIRDELSFRIAKLCWEEIERQWEPKPDPVVILEEPDLPAGKYLTWDEFKEKFDKEERDRREENFGKSAIAPPIPEKIEKVLECAPMPVPKPEPVKKAPAKKRGGYHGKGNKYGIPSELFHTDKQAYQRLWFRCKKGGITYEEALKMERAKKQEPDIKIGGADAVIDKLPDLRPPTTGDPGKVYRNPRNPVPVADIPNEFKVGVHVKQVKPYNDRKVSGIGVVTARVNGLIEVNFAGTQYYKIAPDCLEVV